MRHPVTVTDDQHHAHRRRAGAVLAAVLLLAACGGDDAPDVAVEPAPGEEATAPAADDGSQDGVDRDEVDAAAGEGSVGEGSVGEGSAGDGFGSDDPDGGEGAVGPGGAELPDGVDLVTPSPDTTTQTRAVAVDRTEVLEDGSTLRVFFSMGVDPCDVLDDVVVTESSDRVELEVRAGRSISAREDVACIQVLRAYAVDVELDAPLDGREVVDAGGAASGGVDDGT